MSTKQVIVVRRDLNMSKGKLAAQVSHASMASFLACMKPEQHGGVENYSFKIGSPVHTWLENDFTKVVLGIDTEKELDQLYEEMHLKIPCYLIVDNGRTEFKGIPTKTCLGIGPDLSANIDVYTKHLKLL